MQSQLDSSAPYVASTDTETAPALDGRELWRGSWVIFSKHLYKFRTNSMEIGGTLGWPLLWIGMFGLGMARVVDTGHLGIASYLAYITPGIIALTALSGAVNSGMTFLEEKTKGLIKEYFVAPIPRMSILLAATGSGMVKTLLQSAIILVVALIFGARITGGVVGLLVALLYLLLYVMAFVGFSNGVAAVSRSTSGYHMLLFVLNLPLLFLSNALYPLATMPLWMHVLAHLNPTTYAVDGIRHALFGVGELPHLLNVSVLILFAVLCNWFGLRSFRGILEQG